MNSKAAPWIQCVLLSQAESAVKKWSLHLTKGSMCSQWPCSTYQNWSRLSFIFLPDWFPLSSKYLAHNGRSISSSVSIYDIPDWQDASTCLASQLCKLYSQSPRTRYSCRSMCIKHYTYRWLVFSVLFWFFCFVCFFLMVSGIELGTMHARQAPYNWAISLGQQLNIWTVFENSQASEAWAGPRYALHTWSPTG